MKRSVSSVLGVALLSTTDLGATDKRAYVGLVNEKQLGLGKLGKVGNQPGWTIDRCGVRSLAIAQAAAIIALTPPCSFRIWKRLATCADN